MMETLTKENARDELTIRFANDLVYHEDWFLQRICGSGWIRSRMGKCATIDESEFSQFVIVKGAPEPPLVALGPDSTLQTHGGQQEAVAPLPEHFDARVMEEMVTEGLAKLEDLIESFDRGCRQNDLAIEAQGILQGMWDILHVPAKTVRVRKITGHEALAMIINNLSASFTLVDMQNLLNNNPQLADNEAVRYEVTE